MLQKIIGLSLRNKVIVLIMTLLLAIYGVYSITKINIGAVPDVTNNQIQVITTSRNLSTEDIEQFITYPVELEMANLPGVIEIRSISKFGLSVVTVVFKDDMGTYLPRQLIAEKIRSASEKIPEGFGTPEMGPITTGLGEIYQYVLDVEPGYENQYSPTQLRTIQDWIVKRQLSGIPGVVEVNTWGGFLKQYEVAVNTQKLDAMNIGALEVFRALERNNSIAGGAYIERFDKSFFIRGEGMIQNLDDIRFISVTNRNGIPVYIKDVATVGFGTANRFGAITGNGEGEKVLGQVMMLKDGNSRKVIQAVKNRVDEISANLPEGVYINPFLERSELIGKTTRTVSENLLLGCLIVVFVVVILLGNWRSGLVVSSIIPLSLLFTIAMMRLFNVHANLMSLGAIDFGIIIDGSVIIVEYIAFQMTRKVAGLQGLTGKEQQIKIDEITFKSASKMMNSAIFGQLIILIVFLPIYYLSGIEGKMFKPMAMTFSFALVGAMILGLTYVPVMASLFIKPEKVGVNRLSARLIERLQKAYEPLLIWALSKRLLVVGAALTLLLGSGVIFSRLGAEFVPTLDEGDFVIQPILKSGTSLSKTVEITTRIEKILLEFPEVEQVVSRIGAAEIPTDPMSMEDSDVIIKLKPKDQWVTAKTKDGLAEAFSRAIHVIPGLDLEFTQPIEMRFNELITGVRSDIAIKIFGEDLEVLAEKGQEVKELIQGIPGAEDISVEKTVGLPQMRINYDRTKIARYGLDIATVNDLVSMGFAGAKAGAIFEGEERYDLVMRLEKNYRSGIDHLKNLYVDSPLGYTVPLQELASIEHTTGPAKISRDDTKRRIVVSLNVRNNDLQSVIDEIRVRLDDQLELPPGYEISYGGQFENLQSAREKLLVAVPIALSLIFVLLYLAFRSISDTLLIYSAIPFATVGGILFLALRGMPFSISAGVGFIALFGIAVLNGIVLIEHYKELKNNGMKNITELVLIGTKERLRPVLLTASAAALGFLPMVVSTGAGAEVQRPLATVVIGGLVSSTILTLLVLPVLYTWINSKKIGLKSNALKTLLIGVSLSIPSWSTAQENGSLSLHEVQQLALENNAGYQAAALRADEAESLISNAFDFDKTEFYYHYDENNLARNDMPLKVFGIEQDLLFPSVYFAEKKANKAHYRAQANLQLIEKFRLQERVTASYYHLQYEMAKADVYKKLDSFYIRFAHAAKRRFETGETNYLESITAKAKQRQLQILYKQAREDVTTALIKLQKVVQSDTDFKVVSQPLIKLTLNQRNQEGHPGLLYYQSRIDEGIASKRYESQRLLPDLTLGYFGGSNEGLSQTLTGYQIGIKVPLLFSGNASRIKAAKINNQILEQESKSYQVRLDSKKEELLAQLRKYEEMLLFFEEEGEHLSTEIFDTATRSYQEGEINFFQYIQSIENALDIQLDYLNNLNAYNQTVIKANHLTLF